MGTTENEINELGADAEILKPSERRVHRLRHEEAKWDPEHYMYVVVPFSFPQSESKTKNLKRKERHMRIHSLITAVIYVYDRSSCLL